MIVRELIDALLKAPPEATVWIDTEGGWRCDVDGVVQDSDIDDNLAVVVTSSIDPNYTGYATYGTEEITGQRMMIGGHMATVINERVIWDDDDAGVSR